MDYLYFQDSLFLCFINFYQLISTHLCAKVTSYLLFLLKSKKSDVRTSLFLKHI